jgi:hypothetical protein
VKITNILASTMRLRKKIESLKFVCYYVSAHILESRVIEGQASALFYFIIAGSALGPLVLTYFYFTEPGGMATWFLALTYVLIGAFMYWMNQMRKNSPRYFLGFIDWLDWKFFNGKGNDGFRGRKMLVLTVLGLILGVLVDKAGLGLIIGLFLGATMEYQGGI